MKGYKIIDIHCHLLPGLDGGAADMECTVEMLRLAAGEGIVSIIATPHRNSRCFACGPIVRQLEKVQKRAARLGIPITLYSGAEQLFTHGLESLADGDSCARWQVNPQKILADEKITIR